MIRVLRLIEYTYETPQNAEDDMARWSVPAIGAVKRGTITVRSTILTDLNFEPETYTDDPHS